MTSNGQLYIVSAPSGAGKTSLVNRLIQELDSVHVAVSHTTRPKRPGETDGESYHFVSRDEFQEIVDSGGFLEFAEVFSNLYGTSKAAVDEIVTTGTDVILEIDWQGAQQVRKLRADALSIFIAPPSLQALSERLSKRGQDSDEVIKGRLQEAVRDIAHHDEFDYLVFNDEFEKALADLIAVVTSQRLRIARQKVSQASRLAELLSSRAV